MINKGRFALKINNAIFIIMCILLAFTSCINDSSGDGNKIRVLFIGNSLTSANDLPGIIAGLAKARHFKMDYEMYAPGGYKLSQHAVDTVLLNKIKNGSWDFVVLQEQSQLPAFSQTQMQNEVYPYAKKLCDYIKGVNSRTRIVFYMTMAKKNGDLSNASIYPELGTYEGMQRRIIETYKILAQKNKVLIAPVGIAWEKVRLNKPSIELYADDTHPNLTGSYLAACVFYEVFLRESSVGLCHPRQINDNIATYLQKTAHEAIIEN